MWISIFFYHSTQSKDDDNEEDNSISTPIECYACTQMGVPGFHSTSCDQIHPPEWEACAGSSLIPIKHRPKGQFNKTSRSSDCQVFIRPFGHVLNPRSKNVQRWNRAFILLRGLALAIDPLFFYALSVGRIRTPCLYMDGGLAATVTLLRTSVDAIHLCYLWFQFSLAYVSKESLVVGCGKLVWDAHAIASHYVRSFNGFWFDVFVILPVPQLVFWFVVPKLIKEEKIMLLVTILVLDFAFQYLPKVYHSICLMRRMQKVTGYVFGTIWWGFGLNLIAYLIASHVVGGCWYVLAVQRVASCLRQQCNRNRNCNLSLSCAKEVPYSLFELADTRNGNNFNISMPSMSTCLDGNGPFRYGIYKWALPVVSSNSLAVKIIYPIFWGLVTTCTFGNVLEPTSNSGETIFSSVVTICGLLLFTLLVGNIQVCIHTVMAKKSKMQLKYRDMEWWMRRRQLPSSLKHRVRHFERQRWAAMGGEDEMELIKDLPQGLRRDIKRYICLDLIKKVPLFHSLDDLILDNICDRVKPLVFSKGEKIIREGDPVQRMLFVIRGQLQSKQRLGQGKTATCSLGPGNFLGDELLSWCIRRPFIDRLPASSATFTCLKATEAFGLDANHLHYIIDHFRYKFANERLKRTTRYHSSNWRTWAAVNIQFAWRRYKMKTRGHVMQVPINGDSDSGHRLWQCAAIFLSLKPHDHLE